MNRWKVHRTSDEINPWATSFNGWEDGNLVLRKSHHGTWAEAIAHADQQARTIQVTLPTKVFLPGVNISWNKHGFIEIHAEGNPIDLENLGTALLALHHRKRVRIVQ